LGSMSIRRPTMGLWSLRGGRLAIPRRHSDLLIERSGVARLFFAGNGELWKGLLKIVQAFR
jgi:hypothetical protein